MAKYTEMLSPKSLIALGRRNHIVQDVLISFDLDEGSETSIWHKALTIMVSELVEYCERVMLERYDKYLSGEDQEVNAIVNRTIKTDTFDRRIGWEMALVVAVEALADENRRLSKALGMSEKKYKDLSDTQKE